MRGEAHAALHPETGPAGQQEASPAEIAGAVQMFNVMAAQVRRGG